MTDLNLFSCIIDTVRERLFGIVKYIKLGVFHLYGKRSGENQNETQTKR